MQAPVNTGAFLHEILKIGCYTESKISMTADFFAFEERYQISGSKGEEIGKKGEGAV